MIHHIKILTLKVTFLIVCFTPVFAEENQQRQEVYYSWNPNVYQTGYYLGEIISSRSEGFPIRSLEIQMLLGNDSSSGTLLDASCKVRYDEWINDAEKESKKVALTEEQQEICHIYENPVQVSSMNKSMAFHAQATQSGLSMIFYKKSFIRLFTDTHRIFQHVYSLEPLSEGEPEAYDILSHYPIENLVNYGKGEFHGRVVHAYISGKIRPVYTIVVQEGDSGNKFHALNVAKKKFFRSIVKLMATGKMLRISYLELFEFEEFFARIWPGYQTNFRVTEVALLDDDESEEDTE